MDYFNYQVSHIIKSVEEFELSLGRELTEYEIELVNEHNIDVARRDLKALISIKEYRLFEFIPIMEKQEIFDLIDIYLTAYFQDASLEDLLDPLVASEILGRLLTEKEIELITFLYS